MSLVQYLLQNEPSFRESRLPSLYSDLTNLRNTNPEGFAANAQAWTSALLRLAVAGNLPTEQRLILSTSTDLLNALSSPTYGRPVGLGAVLDEAVREKQMIDLTEFTKSEKSIYAKSWIPSPWSILSWSLRTAGLLGNSTYDKRGDLRPGNLVLLPVLEDVNKKVTAWQQRQNLNSLVDRIFTRDAFSTEMAKLLSSPNASPSLSAKDVDVLLLYLWRDQGLLSYNSTTVKLKPAGSPSRPEPVSQEDNAIANLKSLISSMTVQIQNLEGTISTQSLRAKSAITQNNKTIALAALRSRKTAERTLEQRTATLHQLEEVYTQIENAASQADIVNTLQQSTSALKSLNSKVGSIDSVDAVLDELREEMQKTSEVQDVLAEPLAAGQEAEADELEVDEELEALEKEEREKLEEKEAKETEARLKELEGVGKENQAQQQHVQQHAQQHLQQHAEALNETETNDFEAQLSKSVEKMNTLSLTAMESAKQETRPQAQEAI
jgi:charged multivesicular body protein 7